MLASGGQEGLSYSTAEHISGDDPCTTAYVSHIQDRTHRTVVWHTVWRSWASKWERPSLGHNFDDWPYLQCADQTNPRPHQRLPPATQAIASATKSRAITLSCFWTGIKERIMQIWLSRSSGTVKPETWNADLNCRSCDKNIAHLLQSSEQER